VYIGPEEKLEISDVNFYLEKIEKEKKMHIKPKESIRKLKRRHQ
jgi:hypothetical protein